MAFAPAKPLKFGQEARENRKRRQVRNDPGFMYKLCEKMKLMHTQVCVFKDMIASEALLPLSLASRIVCELISSPLEYQFVVRNWL